MTKRDHSNSDAVGYQSFVDPAEPRSHLSFYLNTVTSTPKQSFAPLSPDLYEEDDSPESGDSPLRPDQKLLDSPPEKKLFGTWDGVFVRTFQGGSIDPAGWIVGEAGWLLGSLMIILASVLTTLTTLSMSAMATNGVVKAGGAYYLISRSLGPQIGGSVGVLFSIGNSFAMGLYIIGFCETLEENVLQNFDFSLTGSHLNDIRLYGILIAVILLLIALNGTGWIIKIQFGLLALLIGAVLSFVFGSFREPRITEGFTGYSLNTLHYNFGPKYTEGNSFFVVFSVFFPASTGIMAGANISGDLRNPSRDIPVGTLSAIGLSTFVYLFLASICATSVLRSASGEYGLLYDTLVMVHMSIWEPLVLCGIYAATISSALISLVGAPRILQSVAQDKIIPGLHVFAKCNSKGEPVRGYFFTFFIACGCILLGEINRIAPLISMFYMVTYTLINWSCFQLSRAKTPGWRPTFRYYNEWTALTGAILCVIAMILTSPFYTVMNTLIVFTLYHMIGRRNINWGSATDALNMLKAVDSLMELRTSKHHIKNYRPFYLILTGDPFRERLHLVRFGQSLKHGHGASILCNILIGGYSTDTLSMRERFSDGYFICNNPKLRFFLNAIIAESFSEGVRMMMQGGLGRIRPNVVMLGYKENWTEGVGKEEYVKVINDIVKMRFGVMVCRGLQTIDFDGPGQAQGLSLLIPYILSLHAYWNLPVQLLIPTASRDIGEITKEFAEMKQLLDRFRLEWSVEIVQMNESPSSSVLERYESMCQVPLDKQQRGSITRRWLQVADEIHKKSTDARLVFTTMPYPHVNEESGDYMALLDALTFNTVPTVLMRDVILNVHTHCSPTASPRYDMFSKLFGKVNSKGNMGSLCFPWQRRILTIYTARNTSSRSFTSLPAHTEESGSMYSLNSQNAGTEA